MKTIDLSEYTTVLPVPGRNEQYSFSIMADGTLRPNGLLSGKVATKMLRIYINASADEILLQEENGEGTHKSLKNGTINAQALLPYLREGKIPVPAKYTATWDDEAQIWIGKHDKHYSFPKQIIQEKRICQPRKTGLKSMIIER